MTISSGSAAAARTRARTEGGSASVEYLLVTILAVTTLIGTTLLAASDGSGTVYELAQAFIKFYADYSFAISLATP